MSSPFDSLLNSLQSESSESRLKQLISNIIMMNSTEILNMVKGRLKYGKGVNGGSIGTYKSNEYAVFKNKQNPLAGFGNVDLYLTGELSDNITVRRKGDRMEIISTDEKYSKIANKYGAYQFGLTDEQMQEFLQECYYVALESLINRTYGR